MRRSLEVPAITSVDSPDGDESWRPSKTRRKQAAHDLQALGLALAELSDARRADLDLPDSLNDAVEQFQRITAHEGRRRQLQYIGKLMRQIDPGPIQEAVAAARLGTARDALALHASERWRDRLIADDDALTAWMQAHPDADLQQLRSLIRAARKEASTTGADASVPGQAPRKGRAFRDLFKFLQQHPDAPSDTPG